MTLKQWSDNGWLRTHKTSRQEIGSLLAIVEYEYVGGATRDNALELIEFVKELKYDVESWLEKEHPELFA